MKLIQERPQLKYPKLWIFLLALVIFSPLILMGWLKVNSFYKDHFIQTNVPVEVKFRPVFEVKAKEEPKVIEKQMVLEYPDEIDTPIEKYICEKFGPFDCKTALAIAKAESGLREDALGVNTNSTVDIGLFQINSIHLKRPGCSLKELVNEYGNTDCAYGIFKEQGFGPWVVYNNGHYLAKLDQ